MATEKTTIGLWGQKELASVHTLEPSWFVNALPEGGTLVEKGEIFHARSEAEAKSVYRQSPAYWLREKLARSMGRTFDLEPVAKPLGGYYVMEVDLMDAEASDRVYEECDTDADMVVHPLSTKLVKQGPLEDEAAAFAWRDENAPYALVCFVPPST